MSSLSNYAIFLQILLLLSPFLFLPSSRKRACNKSSLSAGEARQEKPSHKYFFNFCHFFVLSHFNWCSWSQSTTANQQLYTRTHSRFAVWSLFKFKRRRAWQPGNNQTTSANWFAILLSWLSIRINLYNLLYIHMSKHKHAIYITCLCFWHTRQQYSGW